MDPAVFTGRVASQPQAVDDLLDQAIVHIETVTQQYLRSAYSSLVEYNSAAGEVAERFRFLVIADYPAAFDTRMAEKLRSVLQRGPRCGLYSIVHSSDAVGEHGVPPVGDLDPNAVYMRIGTDGRVQCAHAERSPMWLTLDRPPEMVLREDGAPQTLFGQILIGSAVVGRDRFTQAVTLKRAFEVATRASGWRSGAPAPNATGPVDPEDRRTWWARSSIDRVEIPIGRAGARDVCLLAFDSRAASAALVVGAPGMGKTTLLHSVILGACLQYAPDELELYLLDSKQGVEFKVYEDLPHARAVAIRNEREFGVSVLQGLRDELDRRGALIKSATSGGEVDLPGYRRATGEALPRILLVADEFHELFERVDRQGQQAAELLDDLMRQGRSYGIHVLLGSQTLDGLDALPKHVLQLAQTRIAFQCREQDAAIVMRDDNRDVVALSGPGDGLFNPDRGAPATNQRFQGILVEPRDRVALARALREHAAGRFDRCPVVFDGDAAFPLDDLDPTAFAPQGETLSLRVGEPCAITDAVRVDLPRRPGGNLLAVVDEPTGRALVHVVLAGARRRSATTVVDLTGDDDPVAEAFALKGHTALVRRRGAGEALARLADLVEERASLDDYRASSEVLVITGVKAMRNPDEAIAEDRSFNDLVEVILRDGPEVGVHCVLITDSFASVQRRLPPLTLDECAVRLVTRMSREDSERVLESEAAADLRPHQGMLSDEGESRVTRLRCYEPAGAEWTARIQQDALEQETSP